MSIPTTITSHQESCTINWICAWGYGCDTPIIPGQSLNVREFNDFANSYYASYTNSYVTWPLDSWIMTIFGVSKDIRGCGIQEMFCPGNFGNPYLNVYRNWPTETTITLYNTTDPITTLNNN